MVALGVYLIPAFELGLYGFKIFRYCREPKVREYAKEAVEGIKKKGGRLPRFRTYRFLYLPFPFDFISSDSKALRKIFYKDTL